MQFYHPSCASVCSTGKRLKLLTLFPDQGVAQIDGGVALRIVGDGLAVVTNQLVLPRVVTGFVIVGFAILGQNVTVLIVGHDIDHNVIPGFRQELALRIVGILGDTLQRILHTGDSVLGIVFVGNGTSIRQNNLLDKLGGGGGFQQALVAGGGVYLVGFAGGVQKLAVDVAPAGLDFVKDLSAQSVCSGMAGVDLFVVLRLYDGVRAVLKSAISD